MLLIKNAALVKIPLGFTPVHINRTLSPGLAAAANSLSVLLVHPPVPSDTCPTKLSQWAAVTTGVGVGVGATSVGVGDGCTVVGEGTPPPAQLILKFKSLLTQS